MDRVLRRSLGVSETAKTDATVKPAPPVDPELPMEDEAQAPFEFPEFPDYKRGSDGKIVLGDELKDHLNIEMEELPDDDEGVHHDEL